MKKIFLFIFLINILFACTDVLDKVPLDEITEKTYWTSASDLELYMNRFYPGFRGTVNYHELDNNSDNFQPVTPNVVLNGTRSVPATGGGWNWSNIRRINYFLENADKVTEGIKHELNHYKGEGYFLRAYLYFDKVRQFGDVPWYNNVLNIDSEELYAAREPRNVVVNHIIEDLDMAISLLKDKSEVSPNRINREAALLLKSRICLYEGTWEKYHAGTVFGVNGSDGGEYLSLAVQASGTLISEGNLSLYSTGNPGDDYWQLFSHDDLRGVNEAILIETVDPSQELGTWTWSYLNGTRGNATGITKSMIDSYLAEDGLPISLSNLYKGDTTLTQVIQNRDPRLKQSIWVPGMIQIASNPPVVFSAPPLQKGATDGASTGYMVRKGSTPDPSQNTGSSSDRYGKVDGMVFRYAEALLIYAEAKAELGTLKQEDLDKSVNLIRARVGMPGLDLKVGYTDPNWEFPELSPIINEIRRERRVEFAFEGYRHDDLMRWAATSLIKGKRLKGARFILGKSFPGIENQISDILVDEDRYIDRYKNSLPNGFKFKETRDYLSPIPTTEITLNPNLEQNPGW
ncbi:Starch-binding associating with outer membrane [Mariniphaga anaerophila]|uniref:Starch-binding associating with outer membrane n=1 Tax=Mariniphaga anaerophila TaxID=1484053 RepID=A0A1M4Y795_9BACT|nr:RagB/SusD family nutrient uptake outer membrane protein [Mariniphaga anaerophila]SHF01677.1 Starch-binding associating with outer membrane [Mariniphaga anaerophila]